MAHALGEAAVQAARDARVDLGFGLEGRLPDLLAAIEGPGGAHVVVLDLGSGVARACLQRPPDLVLLFINGAGAGSPALHARAEFGHHRLGHASVIDASWTCRPGEGPVGGRGQLLRGGVPDPAASGRAVGGRARAAPRRRRAPGVRLRRQREDGPGAPRRRAGCSVDPKRIARWIARSRRRTCTSGSPGLLGLDDLANGLAHAAAAHPRLPPALRGSALGAVLTGELTVAQGAAQGGAPRGGVSQRALADLGLAGLVPSA